MNTSNGGEGRSREGKVYTVDNRRNSERSGRKEYNKGNRNESNGEERKNNFQSRKPGGYSKPNNGGNHSYGNSRNYGSYDKDKDEDRKPMNRVKSSQKDSKKEQQPDKIDIMNRIEREKKAIQKKKAENSRKNNKPAKAHTKVKRSNNIDWTREYENGSYDDDELDMYL